MSEWTYTEKKKATRYSRTIPACIEARKRFVGRVPGAKIESWGYSQDSANILVVAYSDGTTTVSMNGTAHMSATDIEDMAEAMKEAKERATRL